MKSINNLKATRRQLLAASGLLAGSLFLPSLRARAQSNAGPPKRLIVFFTQHGTVYDNWKMRPAGNTGTQDFQASLSGLTANEFSPILRPLHAHRNKLTVVDGLAMASVEADILANAHDLGTRGALTGALLSNGGAGGPSIDQVVAGHVRLSGRIDSLELAVRGTRNGGAVWRGANQSISPDTSPSSVYNRLFPASFTGTTTSTPSAAERIAALQTSTLDLVKDEYDIVATRLSSVDRQKLQLHRDLVRDIGTRLTALPSMASQCERPGDPGGGGSDYESSASSMFSLVAAALACDLTRVVTIQMDQLDNSQIGAPPGDVHVDFAHQQEGGGVAREMMTNYGVRHSTQFAALLSALDAIPEGNGTVLDNCAVVWVSELGNGTHKYRPWPVVIGGGAITPGRYAYYSANSPNPSPYDDFPSWVPTIGPPHNKMWVSVANAVGAPINSLGVSSLSCLDGSLLDCTGPLAGLA